MRFYIARDEIGYETSIFTPFEADSLEDVIRVVQGCTWYELLTNIIRITDTHGIILAKVTV